ncbi:hypothetical protein SDJN03_18089, partial [Cucurbita argyrosperma subsp. sororia]
MLFHSSKKLLDSLLCSTNDSNHLCVWFMQETKFSWKPRQEVCTFSPCSGKSPAVGFHSGEKSPPISSAGDCPPRRLVFSEAAAAAVVVDTPIAYCVTIGFWVQIAAVPEKNSKNKKWILHRKSSSEKPKSPHMQHSGSDGELAGAAPVDVI